VIDNLNKMKLDEQMEGTKLDEETIDQAIGSVVGEDGTLPGGMDPDRLKDLVGNPEIMTMMMNPKFQDIMNATMTDGPEANQAKMKHDPEFAEMMEKLNDLIGPS